jgi:hypothetical protein
MSNVRVAASPLARSSTHTLRARVHVYARLRPRLKADAERRADDADHPMFVQARPPFAITIATLVQDVLIELANSMQIVSTFSIAAVGFGVLASSAKRSPTTDHSGRWVVLTP